MRLDFTGDDDVWVFVNKKLALDLGGVHGPQSGSVVLDAANAAVLGLAIPVGERPSSVGKRPSPLAARVGEGRRASRPG